MNRIFTMFPKETMKLSKVSCESCLFTKNIIESILYRKIYITIEEILFFGV